MHSFVLRKSAANRASSPARSQRVSNAPPPRVNAQSPSSRAQIAENARVQVPQSNFGTTTQQRYPQSAGLGGEIYVDSVQPPSQPGRIPNSFDPAHEDRYGTDIENLEDTTATSLVSENYDHTDFQRDFENDIRPGSGKVDAQRRHVHKILSSEHGDEERLESDQDETDGEMDENQVTQQRLDWNQATQYGNGHFDPKLAQALMQTFTSQFKHHLKPGQLGSNASFASYPTTTSGVSDLGDAAVANKDPDRVAVDNDLLMLSAPHRRPWHQTRSSHHSQPPENSTPQWERLEERQQPYGLESHSKTTSLVSAKDNASTVHEQRQLHTLFTQQESTHRPKPIRGDGDPFGSSAGRSSISTVDTGSKQTVASRDARRHDPAKEPLYDYDERVLLSKPFDELDNESFDVNPAAPDQRWDKNSEPIPDLMEQMRQLKSDEQSKRMARLSLEEWEEAGDWFLEKFGDIVKKMKEARKRRRTLAREFEAEVAQRNDRVQKRKQDIETALNEMRRSGQEVLPHSLPKKRRV